MSNLSSFCFFCVLQIWNHPDMYYEAATGQSNADSPLNNGLPSNDVLPSSSSSSGASNNTTSCKIDWVSVGGSS